MLFDEFSRELETWAGAWAQLTLETTVRGCMLLALAGVITALLYRRTAALRHMVWLLALAGVLLLPLLSIGVPAWRVLPTWTSASWIGLAGVATTTISSSPSATSFVESAWQEVPPESKEAELDLPVVDFNFRPDASLKSSQDPLVTSSYPEAARASVSGRIDDSVHTPLYFVSHLSIQVWLFLVWMTGLFVVLAWSLMGWLSLRRLGARARVIDEPQIKSCMVECSGALGLRRDVQLLETDLRCMPMAWGVFRPTILLPMAARDWAKAQLRVVLLHELAHIRQRDVLWLMMLRLTQALHWFNPLLWVAGRKLRDESERACDDTVLRLGASPPDYAEHVLRVAVDFPETSRAAGAAMAMARMSNLERRLRAILDHRKPRAALRGRVIALLGVTGLCVLLPLSAMQASVPGDILENEEIARQDIEHESPKWFMVIHVVGDESGVTLRNIRLQLGSPGRDQEVVEVSDDGVYRLELPDYPLTSLTVTVLADGHVPFRKIWQSEAGVLNLPDEHTFTLTKGTMISGRAVDEDVNPIVDATLSDSWSDELWREKLTSAPPNSRWFVGANFGIALSQLGGDRAYEILVSCWPDIDPGVKKQILKGFQPGYQKNPRLNDRFFDVLHLGMTDPDRGVQNFAVTYLESSVFQRFSGPDAAYRAWRATTRGKKADDIALAECVRLVESLRTIEPEDIPSALKRLWGARPALRQHDDVRETLQEIIDTRISEGDLDPLDMRLLSLRYSLPLQKELEPGDTRDRVQVWCDRLVELWKAQVAGGPLPEFRLVVDALTKADDPRAIPLFIGIIEADNSYDTIYFVGYFGLSKLTGVQYSPYHDGAWWRRWWARNEMHLDEEILNIPIPTLPKTVNGKTYVPFPEKLDSLEGKLEWMVELFEAGSDRSAYEVAREIAKHRSPEAIPIFIGIIDADNSYNTIYGVGYFGLSELTGVRYSPYHDGAWWRRWWARNEMNLDADILGIPIPRLPKTVNGKTHVPFPEKLDTLEGKLEWMVQQIEAGSDRRAYEAAAEIVKHRSPEAIPIFIGIIDADNSYDTIYGVGYFGLSELTGVRYSPYHDGAWWRRWWSRNEMNLDEDILSIPIPRFPKTENGKTHVPFPENLDTPEGMIAWIVEQFETGSLDEVYQAAGEIGDHGTLKAIPTLIAVIEADDTGNAIYRVGFFGLSHLTHVKYDESHDGPWWRNWWETNKDTYPEEIRNLTIPTLRNAWAE